MATGFPRHGPACQGVSPTPKNDRLSGFTHRRQTGINIAMNTTLSTLSACVLALSWEADPALTYTVQTSADLTAWETLPLVIHSSGGLQTVALTLPLEDGRLFARLRYSADGDTDANGLPDLWEWRHFGGPGVDPEGDPDGDGRSNRTECREGTDPNDSYDGMLPTLRLACGEEWRVPAGRLSQQAFALVLLGPDGGPLAGAPVRLRVADGYPGLVPAGEPGTPATAELQVFTDAGGRLQAGGQAPHFLAPDRPGMHAVLLSAGLAEAVVRIRVIGGAEQPPPRDVQAEPLAGGGRAISWSGPPDGASALIVEEQLASGEWIQLAAIASADLPDPDPETGRYALELLAP